MDPLPPSDKKLMHNLNIPQNGFTSKRSMADVRKEKINLYTVSFINKIYKYCLVFSGVIKVADISVRFLVLPLLCSRIVNHI